MKKLIITASLAFFATSAFSTISKISKDFSLLNHPCEIQGSLGEGNYSLTVDNPVKKLKDFSKGGKLKINIGVFMKEFCYILMEDGCYVLGEIVIESDGTVYWVPLLNDPNYMGNYPGFNLRFCPYSRDEMQYAC